MVDVLDGAPEFVDLDVLYEVWHRGCPVDRPPRSGARLGQG